VKAWAGWLEVSEGLGGCKNGSVTLLVGFLVLTYLSVAATDAAYDLATRFTRRVLTGNDLFIVKKLR